MNVAQMRARLEERHPRRLVTIDSHTAGEATRLLLDGAGPVPGATMAEKREHFMRRLDHVRRLLCREPRGHRDILAAAVTEPCTPGAAFGLVYMDARRYPYLCGHATMGAVTTLVELGAVEPAQEIVVDTPSGPMTTRLTLDGDRVDSVAVRSVPAFAMALCAKLEVPAELRPALNGITRLAVDTVCVGGCFVMVDAAQAGLDLAAMSPRERAALVPAGMALIDAANQQLRVRHPLRPEVTTIDVVEFHQQTGPASGTSVVVYGESHMDRSPCGTGTTAKAVLLHRKGALPPGQTFTNAGPLGTAFAARIVEETTVGPLPAAVVEVEGSAVLTGAHEFLLDERDPFAQGFLV